ncbi:hypothetical protein [Tuberibacillus sp. Marseille-P3662]|uniref:hypothetical protein n=1 Tax=Tuberibacillus sp. Marseille-P3662 TaxID=1965358 RepID=UPI000A1CBB09|nr:hypothetical protein [Tuberibacillus sp. Marseille-P3662]
MSEKVTEQELKRLETIIGETSIGPWETVYDESENGHVIRMNDAIESPSRHESQLEIIYGHCVYPEEGDQFMEAHANATFIAESREIVPKLIAEIRRLKGEADDE